MTETKVFLQYPWKFPDSPYYKYLVEHPPREVIYMRAENQKGVITNKKKFLFSNKIKSSIRKIFNFAQLSIPNVHKTKSDENFDLIHCAHCLSSTDAKPWVADFEGLWQMFIGERTESGIEKVGKILVKKNCKKIIPWTEHAASGILKQYPSLKNKLEVVYPAVPLMRPSKKINLSRITLLFVGRYFYWKGGLHALEAMDRLTKKYPHVHAVVISEVPDEIKTRYSKNPKIKMLGLMAQEKVFQVYRSSDIFIYPGYSDSFGFGFLESMSFGVPIITVDAPTRKEIVEDGKTGFLVESFQSINQEEITGTGQRIVSDMVKKTSLLIENKNLLSKMSRNCIEEIKNGKFSIELRNKKLKKIYEAALK